MNGKYLIVCSSTTSHACLHGMTWREWWYKREAMGVKKKYSESQTQNSKHDLLFLIKTMDSQVTDSAQREGIVANLFYSISCYFLFFNFFVLLAPPKNTILTFKVNQIIINIHTFNKTFSKIG